MILHVSKKLPSFARRSVQSAMNRTLRVFRVSVHSFLLDARVKLAYSLVYFIYRNSETCIFYCFRNIYLNLQFPKTFTHFSQLWRRKDISVKANSVIKTRGKLPQWLSGVPFHFLSPHNQYPKTLP